MTFYGLGFHEHRERWITDEWFWYQANLTPELYSKQLSREEVQSQSGGTAGEHRLRYWHARSDRPGADIRDAGRPDG